MSAFIVTPNLIDFKVSSKRRIQQPNVSCFRLKLGRWCPGRDGSSRLATHLHTHLETHQRDTCPFGVSRREDTNVAHLENGACKSWYSAIREFPRPCRKVPCLKDRDRGRDRTLIVFMKLCPKSYASATFPVFIETKASNVKYLGFPTLKRRAITRVGMELFHVNITN